jgi:hypothetical protein
VHRNQLWQSAARGVKARTSGSSSVTC